MSSNRRSGTVGVGLLVIGVVILVFASGADAQSKYKTLYGFKNRKDGGHPTALVLDQAGNLYGAAGSGGDLTCPNNDKGCGVVFKLSPNADGTWTESVLHVFAGGNDGALPTASLIFDSAGSLYGTTYGGGANSFGTVFKLTPNGAGGWTERVLYSFCSLTNCSDGQYPSAELVFDQAGNLYGTTEGGDHANVSKAFKLTSKASGTWTESVLHSFANGNGDGFDIRSGLIFDGSGNLYGTTFYGGKRGFGTVFQLTPKQDGSWTESVLHSFSELNASLGINPYAGLTFDVDGNLYGTTLYGGNNTCGNGCGTVFELSPRAGGSWKEKVLYQFSGGRDGFEPFAGVTFDQAGNIYGTTWHGGDLPCRGFKGACGVVFKLVPRSNGGWKETVPHRFNDHPGVQPVASVIFDPAGNLYGTTDGDNITTFGSVFEIIP